MSIICLIREPFIDKIPNLKTLLGSLSVKHGITIITSKEKKYPEPTFLNENIKVIYVKKRSGKLGIPTSVRLAFSFLIAFIKLRPEICIGGDIYGNIILFEFRKIFRFRHFYLLLEYPQILTERRSVLFKTEKLEIKSLKSADYVIAHDNWHREFIGEHFGIDAGKVLLLPNASLTVFTSQKSNYLGDLFKLDSSRQIILHSGGMGEWFRCREVAESTFNWPENSVLVFHTSHNVSEDQYYKVLIKKDFNGKVLFSTIPVATDQLDSLISSAYIGLAIYSTQILGYRAELLGFAAGKVGNYLKCGLPVIATDLISFKYVTEYKCGVLVKDETDIADAIMTIESDYENYSKNALLCYREKWEPSEYLNVILNTIENI
jgi:glycosyltransferase involved in cell wall biosynthesis